MSSPSKITLETLKNAGITNIYKTNMPDIDIGTCIYDTGGYPNDGDSGRPTVMVWHRNTDYETGYAVMQNIKNILDAIQTGTVIFGYELQGDINYLGQNDKAKYEWSMNFIAYKEGI